jgi:hypothetical protein
VERPSTDFRTDFAYSTAEQCNHKVQYRESNLLGACDQLFDSKEQIEGDEELSLHHQWCPYDVVSTLLAEFNIAELSDTFP